MNRSHVRLLLLFSVFMLVFSLPLNAFALSRDELAVARDHYNNWNQVAEDMKQWIDQADVDYRAGDPANATADVNKAYYGFYETVGFERTVMAYISGSRASAVELQFTKCKSAIRDSKSADDVKAELDTLYSMLKEDADKLDGVSGNSSESNLSAEIEDSLKELEQAVSEGKNTDEIQSRVKELRSVLEQNAGNISNGETSSQGSSSADVATFFACFGILLREGFEAILIVGAIIAYLVKSGNKDKLMPVYLGAIFAIIASFVSAWLLNLLKIANGANQEIIEGVTALIAVVILFYVSNWMVSKAESEAWSRYIEGKVKSSVGKGSMFALGFTAFLAVYREGAEVILFYQPLLAGAKSTAPIWGGFALGCVCLVVVYVLIRYMSVKLPLKPFFLGTSILMFIMSISFLGAGIKELMEGDVIRSYHEVPFIPSNQVLEALGIYPCLETLIPQLILLVITIITFVIQVKKNKKLAKEK